MHLIIKTFNIALLSGLVAAITIGVLSGCSDKSMNMSMDEYIVVLMTPKHFHGFTTTDTLFFKVTNSKGEPKVGLTPTITYTMKGTTTILEAKTGDIIDNHDGIYYWRTTFPGAGTSFPSGGFWVLTFKFTDNDMQFSNAFPLETSWPGGEKIFYPDSATAQYAYMVRWNLFPGAVRGGLDTANFYVELKRSINTPVNTVKAFLNTFDHLEPEDLVPSGSKPVVIVASATTQDTLSVTYSGVGVYKAQLANKVFPTVATPTRYWLHVVFADSLGTIDQDGSVDVKNYFFTVFPQ